jgi:dCTP deaminase
VARLGAYCGSYDSITEQGRGFWERGVILTDREIQIALQQEHLFIEPRPGPAAYSSTSVDLTLGTTFAEWRPMPGGPIRPAAPGFRYTDFVRNQQIQEVAVYFLKPNSFVLAWTTEVISIPIHSRLAARVEGKSSLARLGIGVHLTAPTVHCGFKGNIQLEVLNSGPNEIILDAGMPICQLIFEQTTGTPEKGYQGLFLDQRPALKI